MTSGRGSEEVAVLVNRQTRRDAFGSGFPVAAEQYVLGEAVPSHVHDFVELAVVTAGTVRHETAAGSTQLAPGQVLVVRPGSWHAYALTPGSGSYAVLNAYLGPELLHGRLSWVLDYPRLARLLLFGGQLDQPLPEPARTRVTGWLHQLASEPTGDVVLRTSLLACALVDISSVLATAAVGDVPVISPVVRTAMELVAADLGHPWTVSELAGRVGLSASSLYRHFRSQLGSGPVEWLTRARAERAATLLSQTDLAVATIGRRVGWPDPSYASRRFQVAYAMSPTAYRLAHADPRLRPPER